VRVVTTRMKCYRALGDFDAERRTLDDLISHAEPREVAVDVAALAERMVDQSAQMEKTGRRDQARHVASQSIATLKMLIEWLEKRPANKSAIVRVRRSISQLEIRAGQSAEAARELDRLIQDDPNNGEFIHSAAQLQEEMAGTALPQNRAAV